MAKLRTAIDSSFWDLNISSPQNIDGWAKAVPGDPFPLDASVGSRLFRHQQLSEQLSPRFGIIPSFAPSSVKEVGSFSLQSLLLNLTTNRWWLAATGQFRPRKMIVDLKNEISNATEFNLSTVKGVAKHFIDKSHYSYGLTSQFSFSPSTSALFALEGHGEKERRRKKVMFFHELPEHDLTVEAAWPQLFVDHKGRYWDVPESISVDLSSFVSDSGLRYRFGIHKNNGNPQAINSTDSDTPLSLLPGLCAKAAFTYDKIKYFWKNKEIEKEYKKLTPYDVRLKEPHAAVSGIIGSSFASWIWNGKNFSGIDSGEDQAVSKRRKRSRFNADLFGSVCYTFQQGRFMKRFGDLTRVDARLDISSASGLAKKILNGFKRSSADLNEQSSASPRLNLIFQQQVAGPVVFRADSRIAIESLTRKHGIYIEDFICSLNYSLEFLESGKIVAWYSPKRKEGMVELRLFEF
ncbi:protein TRIGALACTOSYLDIACYLGLYCEROL 4, chloroplastic-like [Trifolium pratense]|uniref:protein TRIGALACTOSYLDIACYLGLYCEROL 4, chloroplastic-like n=1 Tax=Trifolium pratense TaxID=57577 RepID=UPI001E692898|nr:protein TRIGALACTOSYLDIACYLGLYCEROL 4, chloroplastic-like [Trifolium pratense]